MHDDVHDGLEGQPQLAAVQGAVEVGAQGVAAVLLDAQGVVVAVDGAGAGGAGAAQGEVAAAQGLAGVDVGQQGGDAGDGGQPERCRPGIGSGPTAATRRAATVSASAIAAVTRTTKSPSLPRASQSSPRRARVSRAVSARRTVVLGAGRQDVGAHAVDADQREGERAAGVALHGAEPAHEGRPVGQPGHRRR